MYIYDATIVDRTVKPVIALSGNPNTACDGAFDGKLKVLAATDGFGANTKYRYEWTFPAGTVFDSLKYESIAPREFLPSNTQLIRDGSYTVKVTNLVNLCDRTDRKSHV